MKISIIGTGYVGLVSGTCFAEMGMNISCLDVDTKKIDNLRKGILPIWEPNLDELLKRNIKNERLSFTTSLSESIENADACFIAVGTPPGEDGSADLKYVLNVAREIGSVIDHYMVVITKSTVPVGTSEKIRKEIQLQLDKRKLDLKFDIASNPEFLKEGNAIEDCLHPDRIVIGTDSERAKTILSNIYKPFVLNGHPIIHMDIPSAELTKYTANAMLATKISFINEIANLCELLGADIDSVRKGIGSDKRIGPYFIYPGTGYGGSCFPKDVKALIQVAKENKFSLEILKAVENVNLLQKETLFKKAMSHFKNDINGKKFVVWGLAFKPNTDDMREAPSIVLINLLLKHGAEVIAYDPVANETAKEYLQNSIQYAETPYQALENADALFLVTEWAEFRILDFSKINSMKEKIIFDGRNIYDKNEMLKNGITYYSIGR